MRVDKGNVNIGEGHLWRFALTAGIADGRALKNYRLDMKLNLKTTVENMIQSQIDIRQLEPQPISDMKLIVPPSSPTIGNTNVVCQGGLKEMVVKAIPNHKFTASDIAKDIDYPTLMRNGFYETCPQVSKILLSLCKEGFLYQWIIGTGGGLNGMTYKAPKWELYYLKRDTELAKTLIAHPNRIVSGYRIR